MAKWADYLISAVRYDSNHERIESIKTHDDKGETVGSSYTEKRFKVVSNFSFTVPPYLQLANPLFMGFKVLDLPKRGATEMSEIT